MPKPITKPRTAEDERADVLAWLEDSPGGPIETHLIDQIAEQIRRGEHVGAAALTLTEASP